MRHSRLVLLSNLLAIVLLVSCLAKASQNNRQQIPLLRKSAGATQSNQLNFVKREISIRLIGLQPSDFVNIRPKDEARVAVAGGTLLRTTHSNQSAFSTSSHLKTGIPLTDSSLEVSRNIVTFNRPMVLDQIVFLDIQVPRGIPIEVFVDGESILKASLKQPLSLQNREWGQGALGVPGALTRAAGLHKEDTNTDSQIFYDRSKGRYIVPSSKLEVIKRKAIKGEQGFSAVVVLDIDETGRVTKVTSLTDAPIPNLENTLMKWRFAPYKVENQPVPVTTMLQVSVQ